MAVLTEQQADVLHDPTGTHREMGHGSLDTRALIRRIRRPGETEAAMPESELWQSYLELSKRGEPDAASLFLRSLKNLHRRRAMGTAQLSHVDPDPWEHRMADDPYVGELWKAYKRCISQHRTGPAGQLLRDLEAQLEA